MTGLCIVSSNSGLVRLSATCVGQCHRGLICLLVMEISCLTTSSHTTIMNMPAGIERVLGNHIQMAYRDDLGVFRNRIAGNYACITSLEAFYWCSPPRMSQYEQSPSPHATKTGFLLSGHPFNWLDRNSDSVLATHVLRARTEDARLGTNLRDQSHYPKLRAHGQSITRVLDSTPPDAWFHLLDGSQSSILDSCT